MKISKKLHPLCEFLQKDSYLRTLLYNHFYTVDFYKLIVVAVVVLTQAPLNVLAASLLQIAAGCCEWSDVIALNTNFGSACRSLVSETFLVISPYVKDPASRHQALRIVLSSLRPRWLAARVADMIIGLYDVSMLQGEGRRSLTKPLSLEKVVTI